MSAGVQIISVTIRSGSVYVLAYLPANTDHDEYVASLQEAIDPTRRRKIVRAEPIPTDHHRSEA